MSMYMRSSNSEGNTYYVEIDEHESGTERSSNKLLNGEVQDTIDAAIEVVEDSIDKLGKLDVDEIEVEFGMKVGTEAGLSFWAITKAMGEANINVKVKWRRGSAESR